MFGKHKSPTLPRLWEKTADFRHFLELARLLQYSQHRQQSRWHRRITGKNDIRE
jgi:hypothetical protein